MPIRLLPTVNSSEDRMAPGSTWRQPSRCEGRPISRMVKKKVRMAKESRGFRIFASTSMPEVCEVTHSSSAAR